MALSEIDRNLLERCLQRKPRAWEDFVDRFVGLIVHVINHTARARSVRLSQADRDDLCADVLLTIIKNEFAVLHNFRGKSSLATYLTVVTRRIVVKDLLTRMSTAHLVGGDGSHKAQGIPDPHSPIEQRLGNEEEVQRLLGSLQGIEADVVRLYHLEGRTYQEIGSAVGISENSVGPILSRARSKLRQSHSDSHVT